MKLNFWIKKIKSETKINQFNKKIKIDMGCGGQKQEDFFGIDLLPLPGVDLVWDLEKTPYPLPDECANVILASHVVEHINPHKGVFIDVMNEWWRLMSPGGKLLISTPYAGSIGYWQDPTHCNPCNEITWGYFDPTVNFGDDLYKFYTPKPWKIIQNSWKSYGNLEVVLQKLTLEETEETRSNR